jgi:transposase
MEMEKYEVRVLLRHYWKQNYKAVAAGGGGCDVEGEGAVNERTAQRWFKRFASGKLSLEDEQRPGRSRIWDSEATKEAAEQQPLTSTRRLSDTLDPFKEYYSSLFYQVFKELAENECRPLNMRACILNIELILFCMFWPITFSFRIRSYL